MDYATFSKWQVRQGKGGGEEALAKALKDAGVDGLPLKSIATTPDGTKVTMEVVKVDKKSLPASTFEIPAGYTKSEGGLMGLMGGFSGPQADDANKQMQNAQQQMQEALKNLPPDLSAFCRNVLVQVDGKRSFEDIRHTLKGLE